jgi:NADH-quinone oxidoreductase subunit G
MRVQPRTNDDINEEWISDKTRFAVDGLKRQRLDIPLARNADGSLVPVSWMDALSIAADKINGAPKGSLAAIAGPLVEVEALVALKDLINSLGSTSTSSTAAPLSADLRAGYTLNPSIIGVEACDALLLVGSNPRVEAPLLNARIRKMVRHYGLQVASVGKPADLTYDVEQLGDSASALTELLAGNSPFAATLKSASKPAILVGTGALTRADGVAVGALASQLAKSVGCLADGWNGYGVLQPAGSAVGALDVGFVPGPTAVSPSECSLVFLLGADELPPLSPDAFVIYQVPSARVASGAPATRRSPRAPITPPPPPDASTHRSRAPLTVCSPACHSLASCSQGHHGDAGASRADLILPACAYTEKSATYVNTEGRVQRTSRAIDPPGDAREDWQILVALSKVLGKPLPYETLPMLRSRMAAVAPQLGDASGAAVEPSSAALAAVALDYVPATKPALSDTTLVSSVTNFYMSDPVSRASATMAKCVQAFGPRV